MATEQQRSPTRHPSMTSSGSPIHMRFHPFQRKMLPLVAAALGMMWLHMAPCRSVVAQSPRSEAETHRGSELREWLIQGPSLNSASNDHSTTTGNSSHTIQTGGESTGIRMHLSSPAQIQDTVPVPAETPVTNKTPTTAPAPENRPSTKSFGELLSDIRPSDVTWDGETVRPDVLRDAGQPADRMPPIAAGEDHTWPLLKHRRDFPYGFTGPSGIAPTEQQSSSHFIPVEDRWRLGQQDSDRYGRQHPVMDDYPGVKGTWWDPFNQNVWKGDFPIIGQHTFLNITGISETLIEARQLPTPTTPFESTRNPGQAEFFGDPDSVSVIQNTAIAIDLFHGNTFSKPVDWRVKADLVFNTNNFRAEELGVVSPDVRDGLNRNRNDVALQEWFFELKLADISPYYDFASVRAGSQLFVSDFRGFIFNDINRGVRLFGTRHSNRDQFNLIWFDQTEKDTNSLLNRLDDDRHQNTWIANYYRQDFLYPGNVANVSFHANHDQATEEFDRNNFLVRPDPVGVAIPHDVKSYYFGCANNGHCERYNFSNAFYYVFGKDDLNPIAGKEVDISAYMFASEISYDRDWVRFRTSYFYNSGDSDPNDDTATGFDAIFPEPNFAGQEFSFWGRQAVRLFGVELTNREALGANMRNTKFQGQTNFVNPGLHLFNLGLDADITPRVKTINNLNLLWFDETEVLETYLFVNDVDKFIGTDISTGLEWRPLLNNNVLVLGGLATLISGEGFEDLFRTLEGDTRNHVAGFLELVLEY
ncbi:hypothetical protein K227x_28440 [Rubripirellula lacrimiformis]|uniref:Alginate export domain-containing protein n=1 Tax=Rubripirellula lacrimiformis TaxID=1930273 RepID=A0A517NBE6_9BACT|nr:hypothetical protein [Rubripirellula lacrimiformis]QDT04453.1 hypothetical protein K227x_28440 [Rubripirellula lacrimiformis]